MLPKSMAQLTGVIVCSIVVFGTDLDVTYAVPLGMFVGRAGGVFRGRGRGPRIGPDRPPGRSPDQPPSGGIELSAASISWKLG